MRVGLLFLLLSFSSAGLCAIVFPTTPGEEPPAQLSETGLFTQLVPELIAADELRPFSINQSLWVDYAKKTRWLYVPDQGSIVFDAQGPWGFPVGTILVKHFAMEVAPGVAKNLETRILVRLSAEGEEQWQGFAYRWEGDDALLVAAGEAPPLSLEIAEGALGGARTQEYTIPSRAQCGQCHHSSVGFVRGVRTYQVNRIVGGENQISTWASQGLFTDKVEVKKLKAFVDISDKTQPVTDRLKSYLSVHCAHCHNPDPTATCAMVELDFRFAHIDFQKLIDDGYVVPGSPEQSELLVRMESDQPFFRMPYIGTVLPHTASNEVFAEWIRGLDVQQ